LPDKELSFYLQLTREMDAHCPHYSAGCFEDDEVLDKIDGLCDERDRLKKEIPGHMKGKVLGGRSW
jgi:hypothetical protein